jgi:hypothetical protein
MIFQNPWNYVPADPVSHTRRLVFQLECTDTLNLKYKCRSFLIMSTSIYEPQQFHLNSMYLVLLLFLHLFYGRATYILQVT